MTMKNIFPVKIVIFFSIFNLKYTNKVTKHGYKSCIEWNMYEMYIMDKYKFFFAAKINITM